MTDNQRKNFGPRLKEIRLSKKMTLKQFYGPVTDHVNNFSPIEHGLRTIGKRLAMDIIKVYKINIEWLTNGVGNKFLDYGTEHEVTGDDAVTNNGVPFFSINLSDTSFNEFNLLRETPEYYVNFRPFNDCDAYLPVYGDSMYPKYASGEIIAVREIINPEVIQWGEAYLVVADESANNIITVKLLFEHNSGSRIVLRASNPNYKGDTILERHAIKKLFIVKGKIMRNQL
jgi:hypothetical protein